LAVVAGFESGLLTVSLGEAGDHAFLSYNDGNIQVGTTAGASDVYGGSDTIASIAVLDTGTNADQSVTFSGSNTISKTGGGNLTAITVTGIETANVEQWISVTTISGDAGEVSVAEPGRIQHGINLAAASGAVNVAAGQYEENLNVNVEGLTLTGPNVGVHGNDTGRDPEAVIIGTVRFLAADVTFDGFEVAPQRLSGSTALPQLVLQGWPHENHLWSGVTITNNRIFVDSTRNDPHGIWLEGGGFTQDGAPDYGVTWTYQVEVKVTNNYVSGGSIGVFGSVDSEVSGNVVKDSHNAWGGLLIVANENIQVEGNYVEGSRNSDPDFTPSGLLFEGNVNSMVTKNEFVDNEIGLWRGDRRQFKWAHPVAWEELAYRIDAVNCSIDDNTFTGNDIQLLDETRGQYMHAPALPENPLDLDAVLSANTFDRAVVVRETGTDDIKVPAIFSAIQDGINAADAGGTVYVYAGQYAESVLINKSLTLRGDTSGARPEIVLPGVNGDGDQVGGILQITASDVTVEYMHLSKAKTDGWNNSVIAVPRGGGWPNYTIAYDNITFSDLLVEGGDHGTFITASNVTIENSTFTGQKSSSVYFDAVAGTTNLVANTFLGNVAVNNGKAIVIEGFTGIPASSGTINVHQNTVDGKTNFFLYNDWEAPGQKVAINITNNKIVSTGHDGIVAYDPREWVPDFDTSKFAKLSSMTVHDNDLSGVPIGATGLGFTAPAAAVVGVVDATYPVVIDASGNWWGTTDEEAITTSYINDASVVDVTPFLAAGTDTSTDPGFQGDFSTLHVTALGAQTGTVGRIQEGVNLVSGSTVIVGAGTYVSANAIVIGDSLTLVGAGRDDTIVRRDYAGLSQYAHVIEITAPENVTISNLTVGGQNNMTVGGSGAVTNMLGYLIGKGSGYATTDNLLIDNVHFDGGRSAVLNTGDNFTVQNSLFTGNWLRASVRTEGGSFVIQNNLFQGLHYQFGALMVEGSGQIEGVFHQNIVQSNANPGYFKTNGNVFQLEFYNNNVGSSGFEITDNVFDGATFDPGAPNQSGNSLLNRAIYFEYDYVSKPITDSSLITITGNSFAGFHSGGLFTPVGSIVQSNTFTGIERGIIRFDASLSTDAEAEAAIAGAIAGNTINQPYAYTTGPGTPSYLGVWAEINNAILEAANGDTVHISSGTFAENVDTTATGIDKSITLSPGTSPGQVILNGNLRLDANDTLAIEIDGLTAGTGYDQFVVNGTVTLGGAALSASGTLAGVTAGSVLTIIDNDAADVVVGTFAGLANGGYVTISGIPFRVYYNGGDGNDVVLINASPVPETWVDDDWTGTIPGTGIDHDGNPTTPDLVYGMNAFAVIQDAIDSVDVGGTVYVAVGGYTGRAVIDKSLSLIGPQADVQPIAGGRAGGEAVLTLEGHDHPLQIVADDVVVNGLELAQFFYGPEIQVAAEANAHRSNVTLAYNYIHSDRAWTGIVVGESTGSGGKKASGQVVVENVTITHNIVDVSPENKPGYTYSRAFSFTTGFPQDLDNNHVTFKNTTIANNTVNYSGSKETGWSSAAALFGGGLTTSSGSEFHYENFTFDDNVVSNFGMVMNSMNFQGASFQRNVFQDVRSGLYVNIRGTEEQPALFKDNVFSNVATGRAVAFAGTAYAPLGDEYVHVSGNFFDYNQVDFSSQSSVVAIGSGADASTIEIRENSFVDHGVNEYPGRALSNSGTGTVDASGNWWGTTDEQKILDSVSGSVDFTPYLASGTDTDLGTPGFQGDFSTLYVTTLGAQTQTGGRINEAIGLVSASTVIVNAGTYNERVTINKPLTLLGAQAGVDARGRTGAESIVTEAGLSTPNPDVLIEVTAAADGTTIDGFTLLGDQTNTTADTSVIRAWSDDLIVRNNIVDGMHAVIYKGGDGFLLHQNDITGNKTGFVVQPSTTTNVTVTDNAIRLGTAPIADASGVYMTGVAGSTISGNTITGFNSRGIGGSNWTNAAITGNILSANRDGISLWGNTTFIDIVDNDLNDSGRHGINIKGQDVVIEDNRITNSGTTAINVEKDTLETERVTVLDNVLTGNATGIRVSTSAASGPLTFEGNTITGGTNAFDIATASVVNLTDNTTSSNTSGGTITNVATINLTTNDAANTVRVNVDGSGNIVMGQLGVDGQMQAVSFTGVTTLGVNTLGDADTVWVAAHDTTVINLDGGPPATVPGDTLIYVSDGVNAFTFGPSTITTDNKANIHYVNFEKTGVSDYLLLHGTGLDDLLVVQATDANSGTYQLTSGGVPGPVVFFSGIQLLAFDAADGHDILRIHNPAGGVFAPAAGVFYDGGPNTTVPTHNPYGDSLEILGGAAATVEHVFTNAGDGFIHYNGSPAPDISYTGLEPIVDTTVAGHRIFTFNDDPQTIVISDAGVAGQTKIDSNSAEQVTFANPTASMAVNAGDGGNVIHVAGLGSSLDATVTIHGGDGPDTFKITPSATAGFIIHGNLPDFDDMDADPTQVDFLDVVFPGTTGRKLTYEGRPTGNGKWEFDNRQPIDFTGIEKLSFFEVLAISQDAGRRGRSEAWVRVYDAELGNLVAEIQAYLPDHRSGVTVAVADVIGNGIPEIITAPGVNHAPQVKVFQLHAGGAGAGSLVDGPLMAYPDDFRPGLHVAAGDVTGDGRADIVAVPTRGVAEVRVFENQGPSAASWINPDPSWQFAAFDPSFTGGASVAVGDLLGQGAGGQVVVGSGPGMRAAIHVFDLALFGPNDYLPNPVRQFYPFGDEMLGGVSVALGRVRAPDPQGLDATLDLIAGAARWGGSQVEVLDGRDGALLSAFQAYDDRSLNAPVRVAAKDIDGDGIVEVFTGQGTDGHTGRIKRWGLDDPLNPSAVDFLLLDQSPGRPGFFLG
jgi:hypothetical protein